MAFVNFFKSPETRAVLKHKQAKATIATRRTVYRLVEQRDKLTCRACGWKVVKAAGLRLDGLEHHHIHDAGDRKIEATHAICVVCKGCHDERHVTRVLTISGNADKRLRFEKDGRVWHG